MVAILKISTPNCCGCFTIVKCYNVFSCSFFASASNHERQATAVRDSKVFIALVSDAYTRERTCADLFQFARLTLRKPLVLVVIGEGREWRTSKLGILVADEVYINMAQVERYNVKIEELVQVVEARIRSVDGEEAEEGQNKKRYPPCFISYSWVNSHEAVAAGTRLVKIKHSRAWFRSTDLWVMGPARFHCATLLRTTARLETRYDASAVLQPS